MVKIRKYFRFIDFLNGMPSSGVASKSAAIKKIVKYYTTNLYVRLYSDIGTDEYRQLYAYLKFNANDIDTSEYFVDVFNELVGRYGNWGTTWVDYDPTREAEPTNPYVITTSGDPSTTLTTTKIPLCGLKLGCSLYSIYNETKDRYETLLGYYASEKDNLLNKIKSKSIARYNDTPQNGGDWSDDEHTTNITQNESESDMLPLMDRLTSIQNNYRNLVKEWADEFKGLFIPIPEDEVNE